MNNVKTLAKKIVNLHKNWKLYKGLHKMQEKYENREKMFAAHIHILKTWLVYGICKEFHINKKKRNISLGKKNGQEI